MHIFIQLFFIRSLQKSDAFYKSSFFPQLFNTPVWRPNTVVVRELFRSLRLISITFVYQKYVDTVYTPSIKSKTCWESALLLSRLDTY